MMHLFMNALAASAGGGITYIRNVVPQLAARSELRATVSVNPTVRRQLPAFPNVELLAVDGPANVARRFAFEQRRLPGMIRSSGADVLVSTGNFALWRSPVPQILLSRNALYTSGAFVGDLRRRGDYGLWIDTKIKGALAAASVRHADLTIAPSEAFAEEVRQWAKRPVVCVHHGFDLEAFRAGTEGLPAEVSAKLARDPGTLRLLFVSHYNYYRNFETLFRALPLLQQLLPQRRVQLALTCRLHSEHNPGSYQTDSAAALVEKLGVAANVLELGTVAYTQLHQLHRLCDIYVSPAYAESFAHPLVEAMSSGMPIVASDLAVHREICRDAAVYFVPFSAEELARQVAKVASDSGAAAAMRRSGLRRSEDFSWSRHVDELLAHAARLLGGLAGDSQRLGCGRGST